MLDPLPILQQLNAKSITRSSLKSNTESLSPLHIALKPESREILGWGKFVHTHGKWPVEDSRGRRGSMRSSKHIYGRFCDILEGSNIPRLLKRCWRLQHSWLPAKHCQYLTLEQHAKDDHATLHYFRCRLRFWSGRVRIGGEYELTWRATWRPLSCNTMCSPSKMFTGVAPRKPWPNLSNPDMLRELL